MESEKIIQLQNSSPKFGFLPIGNLHKSFLKKIQLICCKTVSELISCIHLVLETEIFSKPKIVRVLIMDKKRMIKLILLLNINFFTVI